MFFFYFLFSSFHYFFFWFCRTYFQKFYVFNFQFLVTIFSVPSFLLLLYTWYLGIFTTCVVLYTKASSLLMLLSVCIYILNDVWFWEDKNFVFFMNSSLDHPFCMSNWSFFDRLCVWLIFLLASLYSIHCCLAAAYI